jgi:glucose dehydrogenase
LVSRQRTTTALAAVVFAAGAAVSLDSQNPRPVASPQPKSSTDWPRYGGTLENDHYSPLAQVNRENVGRLQLAWQFDTGEEGGLQTSPIIVNGVLYGI